MRALRSSLGVGLRCAVGAACVALVGCSGGPGGGSGGAGAAGGPGAGGSGGIDFTSSGSSTVPEPDAEVFAHSDDILFRLDPKTKDVTTVGVFEGCDGSVIDIAIDEQGQMFATTFSALYRVDRKTAVCSYIAGGSYPNSLSFVPKGTVAADEEALVGYDGAFYVRIDKATGTQTLLGKLEGSNPVGGYGSSGDIVSVIGGDTYLTVKGADCNDCIVRVDPTTGAFEQVLGSLSQSDVFGLAFWGGIAYGFTDGGQLLEINLATATTSEIPMPNKPAGLRFWGAGSTTAAPVSPIE